MKIRDHKGLFGGLKIKIDGKVETISSIWQDGGGGIGLWLKSNTKKVVPNFLTMEEFLDKEIINDDTEQV